MVYAGLCGQSNSKYIYMDNCVLKSACPKTRIVHELHHTKTGVYHCHTKRKFKAGTWPAKPAFDTTPTIKL